MKKGVFIETDNVNRFRTALRVVTDAEKGQPGLLVVRGPTGRGKTMATRNAHAVGGGVFLRVYEGLTQAQFLCRLCFETCGMEPSSGLKAKVEIIRSLESNPRPLFIDEADRLATARIADLRDIHDETGCAVVFIGEEKIIQHLSVERRLARRVTQMVDFGPVTPDDVILYAAQAAELAMDPAAAEEAVTAAEGEFRLTHNLVVLLEQAAAATQKREVGVTMVRAASKRLFKG